MIIDKNSQYDVLVVGAGLAGIISAISAAEEGLKVVICSSSNIFSGSSFYPGTWGLGLIGPDGKEDEESLINRIMEVGCDIPDKKIVKKLVENINPSIKYMESLGLKFLEAENKDEKEFIPCFDNKHRWWHGIIFEDVKKILSRRMDELGIIKYEKSEVMDIFFSGDRVSSALVNKNGEFEIIYFNSMVIATGGYGSLFRNKLTTDDVNGFGHYLALKSGCSLINMEFMQMMPGYVTPIKNTVFNEKTFKYVDILSDNKDIILGNREKELLELRSSYGPFTSRLDSKVIDILIVGEEKNSKNGALMKYSHAIKSNTPEFVVTYLKWLKDKKKIDVEDEFGVGIYAHAANGGIRVNENSVTEVNGLFACGEATGGMHGADRIGGLSTANGLVFGRIAGKSAADYAIKNRLNKIDKMKSAVIDGFNIINKKEIVKKMKNKMTESAMVVRSEEKLKEALGYMDELLDECAFSKSEKVDEISDSKRLVGKINIAKAVLMAELMRKESRGSHYREDYSETNPNMDMPIEITYHNGDIIAKFSN